MSQEYISTTNIPNNVEFEQAGLISPHTPELETAVLVQDPTEAPRGGQREYLESARSLGHNVLANGRRAAALVGGLAAIGSFIAPAEASPTKSATSASAERTKANTTYYPWNSTYALKRAKAGQVKWGDENAIEVGASHETGHNALGSMKLDAVKIKGVTHAQYVLHTYKHSTKIRDTLGITQDRSMNYMFPKFYFNAKRDRWIFTDLNPTGDAYVFSLVVRLSK